MRYYPHISKFLLYIQFLLFFSSCSRNNNSGLFYYPADFEPSASTSFIWTTDFYEIIPQVAGIISQKDKVTLYAGENEDLDSIYLVLAQFKSNLNNIRIETVKNKPQNARIRDFGPVYLRNDHGEKKMVSFNYFGKPNSFARQLAAEHNLPLIQSSLNSSGGAREVNGKGTLILCEAHEFDVNKSGTLEDIENAYIEALNVKKVIWLKKGLPQDDSELDGPLHEQIFPNGVNGHVDEFCRFVDESTVLISSVSDDEARKHPILAEAKKRMDENYEILINSTDQDGNELKVIKVPYAPLLVFARQDGESSKYMTLVTSYLNFIVTNSIVILPSYISSAKDFNRNEFAANEEVVVDIFTKAFPSKEIIKLPAEDLNRFSGGFHCISINEPL